jgi:Xyloglucan fucosyltransferase
MSLSLPRPVSWTKILVFFCVQSALIWVFLTGLSTLPNSVPHDNSQTAMVSTSTAAVPSKSTSTTTSVLERKFNLKPMAVLESQLLWSCVQNSKRTWPAVVERFAAAFGTSESHTQTPETDKALTYDILQLPYSCPKVIAQQYSKFHRQAISMLETSRDNVSKFKYVIVSPYEGLGNRIREVVASYVLALLTGRVLLVDWHEEDFVGTDYFANGELQIMKPELVRIVRKHTKCPALENPMMAKMDMFLKPLSYHLGKGTIFESCVYLHVTYPFAQEFLLLNSYHGYVVRHLLTVEGYQTMYAALFTLNNRIWSIVTPLQERIRRADYAIGIQVRTGDVDRADSSFSSRAPLRLYKDVVECARIIKNEADERGISMVAFVTTDSEWIISELQDALQDAFIYFDSRIGHVKKFGTNQNAVISKAIVDWWLLGEVDEALASYRSSFAYTAVQRTGVKAFNYGFSVQKSDWKLVAAGMSMGKPGRCRHLFTAMPVI